MKFDGKESNRIFHIQLFLFNYNKEQTSLLKMLDNQDFDNIIDFEGTDFSIIENLFKNSDSMNSSNTPNDNINNCHKNNPNLKDGILPKKNLFGNQDQVENHEAKIDNNNGSSDMGYKNSANRRYKSSEKEEKVDESQIDQKNFFDNVQKLAPNYEMDVDNCDIRFFEFYEYMVKWSFIKLFRTHETF